MLTAAVQIPKACIGRANQLLKLKNDWREFVDATVRLACCPIASCPTLATRSLGSVLPSL